jgi:rod shape-determining protein MreB
MVEISSAEIREALEGSIQLIIEAIMNLLERTPPELSADIFDRGIILTGGGALLRGLDERIARETHLPVHVADDPLTAVARGSGKVLENLSEYASVLLKSKRY